MRERPARCARLEVIDLRRSDAADGFSGVGPRLPCRPERFPPSPASTTAKAIGRTRERAALSSLHLKSNASVRYRTHADGRSWNRNRRNFRIGGDAPGTISDSPRRSAECVPSPKIFSPLMMRFHGAFRFCYRWTSGTMPAFLFGLRDRTGRTSPRMVRSIQMGGNRK